MRSIKFRSWDNERKMFVPCGDIVFSDYGETYFSIHPNCQEYIGDTCHNSFKSDRFILNQFTGLHDKNGKEVYEGDIIKWKETRFHNKEQEIKGVPMPKLYTSIVAWEEGGFVVSGNQEKDTPLCCFFNDSMDNKFDFKAEIIGNIHENPELLNPLPN